MFRSGVFKLDVRSGELPRHGLKIRLPDQSFQILRALLLRAGELVTRDELRQLLFVAVLICATAQEAATHTKFFGKVPPLAMPLFFGS
ncbi:hypothetical protein LuPra_02816 [Luteitalea pratensis]|uniref:OmpR/PhoB-type domain-containing protein n=1 Tax=Luteitalea pratensis TaxID=1855912 RepID=A0A143PLY2_LUTPR|nr:hypothetical protein LuPra_02816 [Luteitalea pratensis]